MAHDTKHFDCIVLGLGERAPTLSIQPTLRVFDWHPPSSWGKGGFEIIGIKLSGGL